MVLEDARLAEMDAARVCAGAATQGGGCVGTGARHSRPRSRLPPVLLVGAVVRRQHRPGELRGRQHVPRRVRRRAAREPPLSRGGRQLGLLERGGGRGERAVPAAHGPAGRPRSQVARRRWRRSKRCWHRAGSRRRSSRRKNLYSRRWASIGAILIERAAQTSAGFSRPPMTPVSAEDAGIFAETEVAMARLLGVTRRRVGQIVRELLAGSRSTRR